MRQLVLISFFISTTNSCAATAGTATVTTTVSPACQSCTASQVNINTADPADANTHNPVSNEGPLQDNCKTLIITCTPINNNPTSLLTFQNDLGGPAPGNPATVTLVCNGNGQWTYTSQGVTTVITAAYCFG